MKSFQQTQLELTRHLRAPDTNPAPSGVEERRLAIYRDLIFNNIEGFISSAFPVLRSLYSSELWNKLIREFMRVHPCQTPYFLQISQEFLYYLNQEREAQGTDLPFIAELAHYEWVELALDIAEELIAPAQAYPQDPLGLRPRISPLVLGLHYQYPVERISVQFQPQIPEPSALLVYRNRADQVKFIRANPLTLRFVYLLQQPEIGTLRSIFDQLVIELQHPEPAQFLQQGLNMTYELFNLDIISHFDT